MEDRRLREEEEEEERRVACEREVVMTLAEPSSTSSAVPATGYMDMLMFHEGGPATDIYMRSEGAGDFSSSNTAAGTTTGMFRTVGRYTRDGIAGAWR